MDLDSRIHKGSYVWTTTWDGDHLTYSLAQAGYLANKVVPYGSLDDIMPYLSRRAQENHGIIVNAQTERFLYARELKRRLWK